MFVSSTIDIEKFSKDSLNITMSYTEIICFHFLLYICISSSSSQPISVLWRRAHIRAVVFQTLYRLLRDSRLYPYLVTCTIIDLYVFPATLISPTWPDIPPCLSPSHVSVFPPDSLYWNALNLPHRPCLRSPSLPFLWRPSGPAWCWGLPPQSATVNLYWPPIYDWLQPMPGWMPLTLIERAPCRPRTRSVRLCRW